MPTLTDALATTLLQKYEPVLCFDSDNKVLPMDTDVYVRHCALWETPRSSITFRKPKQVREWGSLRRQDLAAFHATNSTLYYLTFAQLDPATQQAMQRQGVATTTSHIIETGIKQYQNLSAADRTPTYHGRAFYDDQFLVLQYWFFYPINDFKTSHGGVNDHEGDWEGVSLFFPAAGGPTVAVVAPSDDWLPLKLLAAAHEGTAPRDWGAIEKQQGHPVFYVARGSHATYYEKGKHFPDQADGQGLKVGPGTSHPWRRVIFPVSSPPDWVTQYDGAWGYYTRDALGGFNGPGGLLQTIKFSLWKGLHFTPRTTWTDPVGEAGLKS
jgi:hypothetical protein